MQITVHNIDDFNVQDLISADAMRRANSHHEAAEAHFRAYEDTENYSEAERTEAYAAHKRHTKWCRDAMDAGLKAKGYPTLDELDDLWTQRRAHLCAVA